MMAIQSFTQQCRIARITMTPSTNPTPAAMRTTRVKTLPALSTMTFKMSMLLPLWGWFGFRRRRARGRVLLFRPLL